MRADKWKVRMPGHDAGPYLKGQVVKRFACDRKIPRTTEVITFVIDAINGADAAQAAEDLAYAVAWHRGLFDNDGPKPRPPANWALAATDNATFVPRKRTKQTTKKVLSPWG